MNRGREKLTSSPLASNRFSSLAFTTRRRKFFLRRSFNSSEVGLGAFFTGRFEKATFSFFAGFDAFVFVFSWSGFDIEKRKALHPTFALRGESGEGIVGRKALRALDMEVGAGWRYTSIVGGMRAWEDGRWLW
jgi:hypothetical protein